MKYLYQGLLALGLLLGVAACSEDKPNDPTIFPIQPEAKNAFEQWLEKNYRVPYNIRFKYKLEDAETDLSYHFIPADSAKTAKLAIITKYLCFDAYAEVLGPEFMQRNAPRLLVAIGTPGYTRQRTEVIGSADGGYKVILGKVNSLSNETLSDYEEMTLYYFHTMHHEFTHILNQKKPYNTSFEQVTKSGYVSGDWINTTDRNALRAGFITPYAMQDPAEDFAEMLSNYVTYTPQRWAKALSDAGTHGAALITQKLALVKDYTLSSWGLDLDELRDVVLRRGSQISSLELNKLN